LQSGPQYEVGKILFLLGKDLIPAHNGIPIINARSDVKVIPEPDHEHTEAAETSLAGNVAAGTQGLQATIGGSHEKNVKFTVHATERKKHSLYKLHSHPSSSADDYDALIFGKDIPGNLQKTWRKVQGGTYELHFFLITEVQEASIKVFSNFDGKTAGTAGLSAIGHTPFHSSGEKGAREIVKLNESGNIGYSFRGFTIYVINDGDQVFVSNSSAVTTEDQLGEYFESRKHGPCRDDLIVTFQGLKTHKKAAVYLNVAALPKEEELTKTLKSIQEKISERTQTDPPEKRIAQQEVSPQRLSLDEEAGENQESAQSFFWRNTLIWVATAVAFVSFFFLAGKQYGAAGLVALTDEALHNATEHLQARNEALCNAIERLRLQSCGPVSGGGTKDIDMLLPWLAMPTYLKAWRCTDQPLSPEQVSSVEESCFDEVFAVDESRFGQAFAVDQSQLDRFDYCGMGLIALLVVFGFLVYVWESRPSPRTAQAFPQRQSHPDERRSQQPTQVDVATQQDGATAQDTDTPRLSASSSLSPVGAGGFGMYGQSASGSQDFANETDEEMGFEDLHWVIQQSFSSGFAVIYHDAEAAHNPRCHLFLQKKDLSTGEVVEDVNGWKSSTRQS